MIAHEDSLQNRRRRLLLDQGDVARMLGCHPTAISHVEAGRRAVWRDEYEALLDKLEREDHKRRRTRVSSR